MSKRRRRSLFTDRSSKKSTDSPAPERDEGDEGDESEASYSDPEGSDAEDDGGDDDAATDEGAPEPAAEDDEPAPEADEPPEPEYDESPPEPPGDADFSGGLGAQPPPSFHEDPQDASTVKYEDAGDDFGTAHLDDNIGLDSVGNFDDAPPPTDEVPSAVLQDVSQPYTAPMNVPEPPPIPGILDRFTPAGTSQRTATGRKNDVKPSYLADTPPPAPEIMRKDTPAGTITGRRKKAYVESGDGGGGGGPNPMMLVVGLVVVLGGGLGLVALAMFALGLAGSGDSTQTNGGDENPTEFEGRSGIKVKVQDGLRTDGEPEPLAPDPEPTEPEPTEPEPTEPQPQPQPQQPQQPQPVRPVPVKPPPKPQPEPVEDAASGMGTLKIRSNRKVLIYVDGKAVGYTPKTYKADPGARTVSAMLPGQPQSKQTQTVDLKGGGTTPVEFTF